MKEQVQVILGRFSYGSFLIGMIVSAAIAAVVMKDYQLVHSTKIGGVVIEGDRIFELVELSDPSQGVVRK
jgi:hypothetical protein